MAAFSVWIECPVEARFLSLLSSRKCGIIILIHSATPQLCHSILQSGMNWSHRGGGRGGGLIPPPLFKCNKKKSKQCSQILIFQENIPKWITDPWYGPFSFHREMLWGRTLDPKCAESASGVIGPVRSESTPWWAKSLLCTWHVAQIIFSGIFQWIGPPLSKIMFLGVLWPV